MRQAFVLFFAESCRKGRVRNWKQALLEELESSLIRYEDRSGFHSVSSPLVSFLMLEMAERLSVCQTCGIADARRRAVTVRNWASFFG